MLVIAPNENLRREVLESHEQTHSTVRRDPRASDLVGVLVPCTVAPCSSQRSDVDRRRPLFHPLQFSDNSGSATKSSAPVPDVSRPILRPAGKADHGAVPADTRNSKPVCRHCVDESRLPLSRTYKPPAAPGNSSALPAIPSVVAGG